MAETVSTGLQGYVKDLRYDYYGRRIAACAAEARPKIEVFDQAEGGGWAKSSSWVVGDSVNKLAWAHPQFGQILACCYDSGLVQIWEETGVNREAQTSWSNRAELAETKRPVRDIAFSPNHLGLKLAAACMDGTIRIFDAMDVMNLSDWSLKSSFEAHGIPRCLDWNPSKFDAPMLVVGMQGDDSGEAAVRVWRMAESAQAWAVLCELERHTNTMACQVNDVAWAPSMGRSYHLIASAGQDKGRQLKIHRLVTSTAMSESGSTTMPTPECDCPEDADQGQGVWRVEWNATGTVLASSGEEGTVRLWKSNFKGEWKEVSAHQSGVV